MVVGSNGTSRFDIFRGGNTACRGERISIFRGGNTGCRGEGISFFRGGNIGCRGEGSPPHCCHTMHFPITAQLRAMSSPDWSFQHKEWTTPLCLLGAPAPKCLCPGRWSHTGWARSACAPCCTDYLHPAQGQHDECLHRHTRTPPISLAAYKWSFLLETDFCLRWCQFFMFQGDWERCRQEEQADNRFIGWPHRVAAPSSRQPNGVKDGSGGGTARSHCTQTVTPQKATPN